MQTSPRSSATRSASWPSCAASRRASSPPRWRPTRRASSAGDARVARVPHQPSLRRMLRLDVRPAPTKVVANLPYGIAASALLRTIEELASVHCWVGMVQREVGERLAAVPGSSEYGAPSVIAQLACEVRVARAIPRSVFHPVPNVDSVLVHMRRRRGGAGAPLSPELRALVA